MKNKSFRFSVDLFAQSLIIAAFSYVAIHGQDTPLTSPISGTLRETKDLKTSDLLKILGFDNSQPNQAKTTPRRIIYTEENCMYCYKIFNGNRLYRLIDANGFFVAVSQISDQLYVLSIGNKNTYQVDFDPAKIRLVYVTEKDYQATLVNHKPAIVQTLHILDPDVLASKIIRRDAKKRAFNSAMAEAATTNRTSISNGGMTAIQRRDGTLENAAVTTVTVTTIPDTAIKERIERSNQISAQEAATKAAAFRQTAIQHIAILPNARNSGSVYFHKLPNVLKNRGFLIIPIDDMEYLFPFVGVK